MINLKIRRLSQLLWQPHKGLWNNGLIDAIQKIFSVSSPFYKLIVLIILLLDTFILCLRAVARRLCTLPLSKLFSSTKIPDDLSVVYFDMGTHKEGAELAIMVDRMLPKMSNKFEAYGFEANRNNFDQVKKKFTGKKHVSLYHKALCYALPTNGKIKLYHVDLTDHLSNSGKPQESWESLRGAADSLYRQSSSYEEVEAIKLSEWLHDNNINLEDKICLLRMNIEGAEYDVIQDLVESGLAKHIDGYYGMWDDVSSIDEQRGQHFRAFLSKNNICPFTFNGRDSIVPLRLKCIEYDIKTHVQAGLLKMIKTKSSKGFKSKARN